MYETISDITRHLFKIKNILTLTIFNGLLETKCVKVYIKPAFSSFLSVNLLLFSSCNYCGCTYFFALFVCNNLLKIRESRNVNCFK